MDASPANIMWKATSESTVQLMLIEFEAVFSFGELAEDGYIAMYGHRFARY